MMTPAVPDRGRRRTDILLLNPNSSLSVTEKMVAMAQAAAPKGVSVRGLTCTSAPPLILEPVALGAAAAVVLTELARVRADRDAVIIGGFGDPGLAALKAELGDRVTGLGEASMEAAARLGRFAVVTTTPALRAEIEAAGRNYGGDRFRGVFFTCGGPAHIMSDPKKLRDALYETVLICRAMGEAETIVIGGGPLAEHAAPLAEATGLRVLNPVVEAVSRLVQMIGEGGDECPAA